MRARRARGHGPERVAQPARRDHEVGETLRDEALEEVEERGGARLHAKRIEVPVLQVGAEVPLRRGTSWRRHRPSRSPDTRIRRDPSRPGTAAPRRFRARRGCRRSGRRRRRSDVHQDLVHELSGTGSCAQAVRTYPRSTEAPQAIRPRTRLLSVAPLTSPPHVARRPLPHHAPQALEGEPQGQHEDSPLEVGRVQPAHHQLDGRGDRPVREQDAEDLLERLRHLRHGHGPAAVKFTRNQLIPGGSRRHPARTPGR